MNRYRAATTAVILLLSLVVVAPAWAQNDDAPTPFKAGTFDVRGGINLDLDKTINLGGTNQDTTAGGGVNLGIGYFLADNLALDFDTRLAVQFLPDTEVQRLQGTPGLRFHVTREIFVRGGVPIVVYPEFGLGALAGLGYRQPISKKAAFVVTIDYTYWLTEAFQAIAPNGQLEVSAGVQTSF